MTAPKMRLMHGPFSPFVRKVMVSAIEKGMLDQIEVVPTAVGAGKTNEELIMINPTGKIPTLVTPQGMAVYDSTVIVEYLDQVHPDVRLIPTDPAQRLRTMRMNATADGLIQAGVLVRTELSREAAKQWPEYLSQQWTKVRHCLRVLNDDIAASGAQITLGEIAAAAALGWVDVRLSEENWRAQNPVLGAWFDRFAQRPSMQQSAPPAA